MKKILTALSLATFAIGLSACGPDNVAQCMDRCQEVNDLPCTDDDFLNCETQCPESWNETGLDYTEYIDCVYGQYSCDENDEYQFESASCTLPS